MQSSTEILTQGDLLKQLNVLFANIQINARKQTGVKYSGTQSYIELDILIPDSNICFEFQDSYHYSYAWYYPCALDIIKSKDNEKKEKVQQHGITLVEVPCWWDNSLESLVATIQFVRPDLLPELQPAIVPIPLSPPLGFFSFGGVPNVGELMLASFPREDYKLSITTLTPWWLGEKYDGMRCCWNPINQQLYTRTGININLLPIFSKWFSTTFIDTEIWFGRGNFSDCYRITKGSEFVCWSDIRVIAFDAPSLVFESMPFSDRYHLLLEEIFPDNPSIIVACRVLCVQEKQSAMFLNFILQDSGEGVILRKPDSIYEHGRTLNLLKLKGFLGDGEAMVVGKDQNSVLLKLPNNVTFPVSQINVVMPISDLKIGDIVTYSYEHGTRREIPLNPKIYKLRSDLSWQDVILLAPTNNEPPPENAPSASNSFIVKPINFWDLTNMRALFEKVARNMGMDPSNPQTWYTLNRQSFANIRGSESVFAKLKGGYVQTVKALFPEMKLDTTKFVPQHGMQYLNEARNRKAFFEDYAKKNKFDPLVAENWYYVSAKQLRQKSRYNSVMQYYSGYKDALVNLFPNIGLDKSKIGIYSPTYNKLTKKRKKKRTPSELKQFLLSFAKKNKFDPLVPENWYRFTCNGKLQLFEKVRYIIRTYYENRISNALLDSFPDIGLDKSRFLTRIRYKYWRNIKNQKLFFDSVAKDYHFDPRIPGNWSKFLTKDLRWRKGYKQILAIYKKMPNALAAVYHNEKSFSYL